MTAEGEKNIVCSCTTGAVGWRHDARSVPPSFPSPRKAACQNPEGTLQECTGPTWSCTAPGLHGSGCSGEPCRPRPPPPRLKPSFPQFLGVLEADSAHLSPASAEENDASKVMCSPCGQPEPKDSSLEETKVRLMSLASDKGNSEGTSPSGGASWALG